jgi:RimJ/RimL family protein N-acetyltransferase
VQLRAAIPDDARQVHAWRNDPWIVSLGSSGRTVPWEEHAAWFRKVLADERWLLWIVETGEGVGAGTVRLERDGEEHAVVTIYLLREFTGKGLGVRALEQACALGFSRWPIQRIHALIRAGNDHSVSAFRKAGFAPVGKPPGHVEMVLNRP